MVHQEFVHAWFNVYSEFVGDQLLLVDLVPNHLNLVQAQLVARDLLPGPCRYGLEVDQGHLHQELIVDDCSAILWPRKGKILALPHKKERVLTETLY